MMKLKVLEVLRPLLSGESFKDSKATIAKGTC